MYSTFTIVLKQGKKIVSERTIDVEGFNEYGDKYDLARKVYKETVIDFSDHLVLCSSSYTVILKEKNNVLKTFKMISVNN